jgi:hypothetical protein
MIAADESQYSRTAEVERRIFRGQVIHAVSYTSFPMCVTA